MKIKKLTITKEERDQAVQEWLSRRGLHVIVSDVYKDYTYSDELTVECNIEDVKVPAKEEPNLVEKILSPTTEEI